MRVTVHHAVGGAEYSPDMSEVERSNRPQSGSVLRCHTLPGVPLWKAPFNIHFDVHDGVHRRWVAGGDRWGRFWVETKVWNDDAPDRITRRWDKRGGYGRSHSVIWPSEDAAHRLRHLAPFVDPATIGNGNLMSCPDSVILEDDPCPHCDGTGTRSEA